MPPKRNNAVIKSTAPLPKPKVDKKTKAKKLPPSKVPGKALRPVKRASPQMPKRGADRKV